MSEIKLKPIRIIKLSDKDDSPYVYPHDCTIHFGGDPTKVCREAPTRKQNRVQPGHFQTVSQKKQSREVWGKLMRNLTLATNFFTDLSGKARVAGGIRFSMTPINSIDFSGLIFSYGPEFGVGLGIGENFYELSGSAGYAIYLSKEISFSGSGWISRRISHVGLSLSSGLTVRRMEYDYQNSNPRGAFCPYLSLGFYLGADQKRDMWHLGVGVHFEPVVGDMKRSIFSVGVNGTL
ncbi:MAG: hypothetical protein ABIE74_05370 [Pseudomonadota bacterium]